MSAKTHVRRRRKSVGTGRKSFLVYQGDARKKGMRRACRTECQVVCVPACAMNEISQRGLRESYSESQKDFSNQIVGQERSTNISIMSKSRVFKEKTIDPIEFKHLLYIYSC